MIIRLTKYKNSATLLFKGETKPERADLVDVVLGMTTRELPAVLNAIEELGRRGYRAESTKKTKASVRFNVRKVAGK